MDVSVSTLRAQLRECLDRVRDGEEIVVTERGTPVARIVGASASALLEELEKDGHIARPKSPDRPKATGRRRVRSKSSVADLVSQQRD